MSCIKLGCKMMSSMAFSDERTRPKENLEEALGPVLIYI